MRLLPWLALPALLLQPVEVDAPLEVDDAGLLHEVRRVSRHVERLLDARFDDGPVAERASADLRRVVTELRLAQLLESDRLEARGRAWEDIGLGTSDSPFRIYRLLAEDLEGVTVDPTRRRLLVDPACLTLEDFVPTGGERDSSSLLMLTGVRPDEPLIVHALVHLLQEQSPGGGPWPETTDALLAFRAWQEGQANLAAVLHVFSAVGVGPEIVAHTLDPGEVMDGALLPISVDALGGADGALLDWVYRDGYEQAAASFRRGGPAALREAMATRRTTRDVRHLDRAPLQPDEIAEPSLLGQEALSLVDRDSIGEQGVSVLVSSLTAKDNLGLIAADGWSGDALLRWEDPAGRGITLWVTRWVSEDEADDFEYGYLRGLERRFPESTPGDEPAAGQRRFEGGGRIVVVTRDGNEVRVRVTAAE